MDELQLLLIHLGKKVKYLRRLHNLTQAQLAEKADLSVNYVSEIETGTACPTLKTLFILSRQLQVQLRDLFDFDHDRDKQHQEVKKRKIDTRKVER